MTNFSTEIISRPVETACDNVKSAMVYRFFGKRLFDICLCLVLAPIVFPVILLLALIVRRDGGSAFFKQARVGKDGKHFRCLKLRTMRVDAEEHLIEMCRKDPEIRKEWELYQKLDVDPRITKIGNILRKTSLDELPQFLNVLFGDMSFFGPRPFLPSQSAMYLNAGGKAYFKMRPGISGAWQVSTRNESTFIERVGYDEEYYRTLSLVTDINLFWKTFAVVIKREGK
ncbi:lipopolysaccharide/colanic/teichoic acid biosynthesis glycosyltransferase [Pacificibacter maritimus]|uniref:Lipopolysaccharide/colanic/teichoic acid biosynthesis glycosyltransferase n=1 Tax=Pacificibacter maritimus TaxID=762213 RepID=A0A3N4U9D4_9RHOB|nr:sugar transferase [Pacificibacter maritimus]RPE67343.1 lipopolysaccharide/colanic/teichoic acid biosynthesis glycosyltransferase [Pacificibacter maritimus]